MGTFTNYYVQAQEEGGLPEIVWHSKSGYKFLDRKKAVELRDKEKALSPDTKFRIVKITENYKVEEWI